MTSFETGVFFQLLVTLWSEQRKEMWERRHDSVHMRWLEKMSSSCKRNERLAVEQNMLSGLVCDWLMDWMIIFSDFKLSVCSKCFQQREWSAFDGRPMDDLASCNWRVFEALGCFDTSLKVFVRKARIESVNFIVYRAWNRRNNHSSGKKPY